MFFVEAILAFSFLVGAETDRIAIGLLAATGPAAESLVTSAETAVDEINAAGGIGGVQLDLVTLDIAGPWDGGADMTARLVFEHRVVGLIGPTDDTAAHVAAQVATRKRIPVITLSPEDSLTRSMVPWVFRGVPDDSSQARALLRWSFGDPRGRTAAIAVPEGRSGRERAAALTKACDEVGVLVTETASTADVLLLWLDPGTAIDLLGELGRDGTPKRILGSTRLDDPVFLGAAPAWAAGLALPLLRGEASSTSIAAGLQHALGYDAVRLMAAAMRSRGSEPTALRVGLAAGRVRGRSGTFGFGPHGNRLGPIEVGVVRDGRLHRAPATLKLANPVSAR